MTDIGRMNRHVKLLCARRDITIRHRRTRGGVAYKRPRIIDVPPIKSMVTYYVALHEIGHIIGKGRSTRRLEQEYWAWKFALDRALFPPDQRTWQSIQRALGSYIHNAQVRADWADARGSRHPVVIPPREHPVWELMQTATAKGWPKDD